jgi:hypothetical protein
MKGCFLFICLSFSLSCFAHPSLDTIQSKKNNKVRNFVIVGSLTYGAALYGLNELWYKDFPRQDFHFFNDNTQWKQVDKIGHFYSAYHLSRGGEAIFRVL